tara:strand:+ start:193 stop:2151 length:1959 start_codon:yes stop_codon:yes gene_type:complete
MGTSYPDRTNARGIWRLSDITKNIKTEGTHPSSFGDRAIFMGGNSDAASNMQEIDTVQISTAGNSTDFGDLTAAKFNGGAIGGNFRGIHTGGRTPTILNVIEYIHFASTGNAADFGDLTSARMDVKSINNLTRGVTGSGATPGNSNVIDFITIQTLGNATDFGDLTVARSRTSATQSPTRGVWGGGFIDGSPATYSNVLDFIEISSAGNATDFGDMVSVSYSAAYGSQISGMWGGGRTPGTTNTTAINKINFGSLGNSTDFGDLGTARGGPGDATANSTKGIYAGGENPSGTTWLNEIETESLTSSGTGVDFGDLSRAKSALAAVSQAHGGLTENFPRAPELYSPTGKVVPRGGGAGQTAIYACGSNPGQTSNMEIIQINTLGNTIDFGNMTVARYGGGPSSNSTRGLAAGGYDSGNNAVNVIDYVEMATKGNGADFGNLTVSRFNIAGGVSNDTRGIIGTGSTPSLSNTLDYITIATIGDASDFGDLDTSRSQTPATQSNTRGIFCGGQSPSYSNVIDYITIGSTGNATDFGDLSVSRGRAMCASSTTRGVIAGGSTPGSDSNVMDYVTIASTGNATDFGDLTDARRGDGCGASNQTRGVFMAGYDADISDYSTVLDYITIASTGNATDFGDMSVASGSGSVLCNGHGGLS